MPSWFLVLLMRPLPSLNSLTKLDTYILVRYDDLERRLCGALCAAGAGAGEERDCERERQRTQQGQRRGCVGCARTVVCVRLSTVVHVLHWFVTVVCTRAPEMYIICCCAKASMPTVWF